MCGRNYHIIIQLSNIVCVLLFLGIQYVFEFVYSTGSISVMSNYYNEQWMETILHQLVDGLSHYCKAHVLQCFIVPNTTGFPDFVHLQDSSTFHNVFQPICPDSSLKWWSSSIKDWCLVQCSATLGAAQLRRVFFFKWDDGKFTANPYSWWKKMMLSEIPLNQSFWILLIYLWISKLFTISRM